MTHSGSSGDGSAERCPRFLTPPLSALPRRPHRRSFIEASNRPIIPAARVMDQRCLTTLGQIAIAGSPITDTADRRDAGFLLALVGEMRTVLLTAGAWFGWWPCGAIHAYIGALLVQPGGVR
jgi:hypothetical protein